jgi:hypothetical protein
MSSPRLALGAQHKYAKSAERFVSFLHSEFGLTFLDAKKDSGARTRHSSFYTNVLEVNEADFDKFIAEVYDAKDKYWLGEDCMRVGIGSGILTWQKSRDLIPERTQR